MPKTETMVIRKGNQDVPIQVSTRFKTKFDKKHGDGSLLKLLMRFAEDREKFINIGQEFQLGARWTSTLYNRFFRGIPGFKFGPARQEACSINRRIQEFNPPDAVRWMWQEALKYNCAIRPALTDNRKIRRGMVIVNGHKCQVRLLQNAQKYKDKFAAYATTSIRGKFLRKTDMQIFVISSEGEQVKCFIVPTEVLLGAYRLPDGEKMLIHIPIKKLPNRHKTYIDWWQYENAWPLLGGQKIIQRPKVARLTKKRKFTIPPGVNIADHVPIDYRTSLLNGKKCAIRLLSSTFRSNKSVHADYMRTNLERSALMNTDFQLFVLQSKDEDKYFIVPSEVLIKSYKLEIDAPRGIYIPQIKTKPYRNRKAAFDWWQYENAWHLLEQRS